MKTAIFNNRRIWFDRRSKVWRYQGSAEIVEFPKAEDETEGR